MRGAVTTVALRKSLPREERWGVGNLLTIVNFVRRGHVTLYAFHKMRHHREGECSQQRDKARLKRSAVCCSSYQESALSKDTVSRELELEEPPPGGAGLARARFSQLLSLSSQIWMALMPILRTDEVAAEGPRCGGKRLTFPVQLTPFQMQK